MASILCYIALLLCAVTLSEGCQCELPTIPPSVDWTGDVFEYWNKQRFCNADFGEITFFKMFCSNLPH